MTFSKKIAGSKLRRDIDTGRCVFTNIFSSRDVYRFAEMARERRKDDRLIKEKPSGIISRRLLKMVEAAGIEPASKGCDQCDLHV